MVIAPTATTMFLNLSFFLLVIRSYVVHCDTNFFLIHKYDDNEEFFCVTNSSFGLTWIDHEDLKSSFDNTSVTDKNQHSEFISKISNDKVKWVIDNPKANLSEKHTSETTATAIIFDRRWEDLPLFKTVHAKQIDEKLTFTHVDLTISKDFRIPFSLRIEKEAHIFLCNDNSVTTSNCYWFLLEALNDFRTVLRRCGKGEIANFNSIEVNGLCRKTVTESTMSGYLSSEFWRHFELLRIEGVVVLHIIEGMFGKTLLAFNDPNPIDVTHLFIHSKQVNGLWKFHKIAPEISVTKINERIRLGPIDVVNGSICVHFFLLMCSKCQIQISLQQEGINSTVEQNYRSKSSTYQRKMKTLAMLNEWREIRFTKNNIESEKITLTITTIVEKGWQHFWAIDRIRFCRKEEFRRISSYSRLSCQLLTDYRTMVLEENSQTVERNYSTEESNCSDREIGNWCVPCFWSSEKCSTAKICENFGNGTRCSCSAGFHGTNCDQECPNGFYGEDCAHRCQPCVYGNCDAFTGTCICNNKYSGSNCTIEPATIFTKGPTIQSIQPMQVVICFENLDVVNGTNDKPNGLKVQCKKAREQAQWNEYSETFSFATTPITIDNLEPETNYLIRGVIITHSGRKYVDERIPFIEFNTSAINEQRLDGLKVHWSANNDLELQWKPPAKSNSQIKLFRIFLDAQLTNNTNYITETFPIKPENYEEFYYKVEAKKLLPLTTYKIRIAADNGYLVEDFISGEIFSPPSFPDLIKKPSFSATDTTITVEILPVNKSKALVCIIQEGLNRDLQNYQKLNVMITNCELLCERVLDEFDNFRFTVGKSSGNKCDNQKPNPPLLPNTLYNITIVLVTEAAGFSRTRVYSSLVETLEESVSTLGFFVIVIFVTIVVTGILGTVVIFLCVTLKTPRNLVSDNCDQVIPFTNDLETSLNSQYCGLNKTRILDIAKFEDYVKTNLENGKLIHQHQIIVKKPSSSTYENVNTNFFYDYIDLRFEKIDRTIPKAYIISQMPQSKNICEFWQMIWKANVKNIIFIDSGCTNDEDSNKTYWPVQNTTLKYYNITIQLVQCQTYTHHSCRKFTVTCQGETRQINHFCFSYWKENDLPTSTTIFTPFFKKIKNIQLNTNTPVVVHCSSGLKRAGFVLLCDICLRTLDQEGSFDVFRTAENLLECRYELINDTRYYLFAHLVLVETILATTTRFHNLLEVYNVTEEEVLEQFRQVIDWLWIDHFAKTIKRNVPVKSMFASYSTNEEYEYSSLDTINVLSVDCFPSDKKFLVTKIPTHHNLYHFWNTVQEQNISRVVFLNQPSVAPENFIWVPSEQYQKVNLTKTMVLRHKDTRLLKGYVWSSIDLENKTETSTIDVFSLKIWPSKDDYPTDISDFVNFCIEASVVLKCSILVVCCDGVTASGLFLALLYNIQTITNKENDICRTVRIMKSFHPKFIKNYEQFRFLWKASQNYLQEVELYER